VSIPATLRVGFLALLFCVQPAATADAPWDCQQQSAGTWNCLTSPAVQAEPAAEPPLPTTIADTPATPVSAAPAEAAEARQQVPVATPEIPATAPAATDAAPPGPAGSPGTPPPPEVQDTPAEPPPAPDGETAPLPAIPADVAAATDSPAAVEPAPVDSRWALCPPVAYPASVDPATATDTIDLQADDATASDGNVYTLSGNAVVQYGQQQLTADKIIYRQDAGEVEALDNIQYTGPGLVIDSARAVLYPEQQAGSLHVITYALPEQHARGVANSIHLDGPDRQQLERASYTTCPAGNTDWVLSARKVDLDQTEGTGIARDAKLEIKDIPVLYTPYISFPIDDRRKSGLLIPKYGHSDETGVDISVPWYWNISPNRDATIVPRFMSDRGTMLGGEFRYLNASNSGKLNAEFLPSDNKYNDKDRSLVAVEHYSTPWPRLETSLKASNVSDDDYFTHFGTTLVETSQISLERTAAANYHGSAWDLGIKLQDFQTIDPAVSSAERPYKQLPQIIFNAAPDKRLLGLKVSTHAELNYFDHSDGSVLTGTRFDIQPRISFPIHRAAWYIDPAVSVRHTTYNLNNSASDMPDTPDRTTPIVSLDAGTFFERSSHWGDADYVQTLEPRLFYLYVPEKNQDDLPVFDTGDYDPNFMTLFRENRFTGPDRMGDANQVTLAVTSRFLEPASGRQRFSASLGSQVYFRDRTVTLPGELPGTDNSSDLFSELTLALAQNWNADAEVQWDPHQSETSRNDYRLQYHAGPRQLVNLSYRHRRDSQEQTDLSFLWPLSPVWHAVGRWYYSLDENETIEALAGLGYESCCWGARLVGRSYINDDSSTRNTEVYFQFELKGLGKLGTKIDDELERGILGYQSSN